MSKKKEVVAPSAVQLLNVFLKDNNISLSVSKMEENIKLISDGSIILGKPEIVARFNDGR